MGLSLRYLFLIFAGLLFFTSGCGEGFKAGEPAALTDDFDMKGKRFVGDMLVDEDQLDELGIESEEVGAAAFRYNLWDINRKKWYNATVPFVFHKSASKKLKNLFNAAKNKWAVGTGVKFKYRTNERIYLVVRSDQAGCFASIGSPRRPAKGVATSTLNIAPGGCERVGIVMHEIGHVLGLLHEHQRPDRDKYVTVHWNNIRSGGSGNFSKMSNDTYHWAKYDFESIMHYGKDNFSKNGKRTLSTKPAYNQYNNKLGDPVLKTEKLSWADKNMIKKWYKLK